MARNETLIVPLSRAVSIQAGSIKIPSRIEIKILLSSGSLLNVKKSERMKESKITSYADMFALVCVLKLLCSSGSRFLKMLRNMSASVLSVFRASVNFSFRYRLLLVQGLSTSSLLLISFTRLTLF